MVYLSVLTLLLVATGRVPAQVHLAAVAAGAGTVIAAHGFAAWWGPALAASGLFIMGVFAGTKFWTSTSLCAVTVTQSVLPFSLWTGTAYGLVLVSVVAFVKVLRVLGPDQTSFVVLHTVRATGVTPGVGLSRPRRENLPDRTDTLVDIHDHGSEQARRLRIYLPPYLLVGLLLAVGLAVR